MNKALVDRYLARFPIAAAALYVALVVALLTATWSAVSDLLDRRHAVSASAELLSQLESRNPAKMQTTGAPDTPGSTGSPFVEGTSVTVAGATLLQLVASEITRAGGNVLSSQVDLDGAKAKDGFVSVVASCELDQPALQQVLYDLEVGFPFLFVDQLVVQAASAAQPGGRLRLSLGVSGQWQGAK